MRIVFMGTPEFAVPSLEHLVLNKYQVAAVYTQPDRAAGRGRVLVSSPVKQLAVKLGIPVVQPDNFKNPETVAELAALKPDVIVVAAFGQILPQPVLDIPERGCLNVHPSLLPKFRGTSPVTAAILAGDRFTGVSIMLLDAGMDTGPILLQAQVTISLNDTTGSLTSRLSLISAHLLLEALPRLASGLLFPRSQEEAGTSYTSLLNSQQGEIDWNLPAVDIWRKVRAFQPWPGCFTTWQGKQLRIIEAVSLSGETNIKPGQVVTLDRSRAVIGVGTLEGILGLLMVQLEGKRAMSSAEFLRGQKQLIGALLPSKLTGSNQDSSQ
ncbi:methionyl-tRNA formyltransferase [Chloroflexota bacterium]